MFHELIDMADSVELRRIYAVLGLIWLPFALLLAVVWSMVGHVLSVFTGLADDLYCTCRHDVPDAWRELIFTLRTGDPLHA